MELAVLNTKGQETGRTVSLPASVFGVEPNDHLLYMAVKHYLANQRQGTHKAKERNEVAGSKKKLKRQKGTGGARAGSIKSPLFRGGGRIFGPRPRDYRFKMNKKEKLMARFSALSYKAKDQQIAVLEKFTFETPRTKAYLSILQNLQVDGIKTLLVLGAHDSNVYLSSRNLQKAKVVTFDSLNTYDIMHADRIILAEDAVARFSQL